MISIGIGSCMKREGLTKAIRENGTSIFGPDHLGILDRLPWHLWKRLARNGTARLLGPEPILLAVGRVPNPVHEQVCDVQTHQGVLVPRVGAWMVVGQVNRTVAVRQRHASQIPEDEHEPPF